jgi:PGF-CTERM protein
MTKRLSLVVIACLALLALLILPASAAAPVATIPAGGDVFIGEQGLDITACVGTATSLAWFAAGSAPATDVPNYVLTIGDPANFYVAPSIFVGRTGNWYQWSGASPAGAAAFNALDPSISIKVWDQGTNKDVSGKSVAPGEFLNFRIETNMYTIAQQRSPAAGIFTIKTKTSDGAVYTALYQSTDTTIPLTFVNISAQPGYWVTPPPPLNANGWNTGVLDNAGTKIYKAGTYSNTVETNVNGIKDNYKAPDGSDYTGKTISTVQTVNIATDTVAIEASKDSVVKGNPFSVTITGRPSTPYILWVKGTGQMSGAPQNQPPFILSNQEGLLQDPVNGPYNIGGYQFQGGAGRTVKQDVPAVPSNGTIYYGLVTLKDTGVRTIGWQSTQDTKDQKYTIRVERGPPGSNGLPAIFANVTEYKSDEVDVTIEKGTVTVVAAGDQSYYLGAEVQLSGTNSETDTVYMFITGPNLPGAGGQLTDPRAPVVDGDPTTFTTASVLDDNTWSYKWQTANLNVDAGTYTIWAVSTPNNRDNLGNTQYSTVSVIIKKPFVSATTSASTVAAGDKLYVRGVAAGQPSPGVAIWVLGKNYASYKTTTVNSDGTFSQEYTQGETSNLASGQYFVVVQHPMYNDVFDVYPSGPIVPGAMVFVQSTYPTPGSNVFQLTGPGSLQGSDAAEALVTALNNPSVDDTYTKLQFLIDTPTINILPIPQQTVGDQFTIKGTTNLAVDDEISVQVTSSSFQPTEKTQSGEFSGASGTVKVVQGTGGMNTWSFPVDSKNFQPDEYIVDVEGITVTASATALFNVVAYVPTTVPTTVVTTVPTNVTTIPTTIPTTVPTTTPGFGALIALVGLGAVAFLVVRKH